MPGTRTWKGCSVPCRQSRLCRAAASMHRCRSRVKANSIHILLILLKGEGRIAEGDTGRGSRLSARYSPCRFTVWGGGHPHLARCASLSSPFQGEDLHTCCRRACAGRLEKDV